MKVSKRAVPAWIPPFLAALADVQQIRPAARAAGISSGTVYARRKRHLEFDRACAMALAGSGYRPEPIAEPAGPTLPEASAEAASSDWWSPFFDALAETSNVSAAAARAGVALQTTYKLRREEAAFAGHWLAALHEGYDNLEMELLGYLRDPRPRRKMDVAAALRLLAAHRETVERRRALTAEEDEQAVLESIDRFIDEMRVRRDANNAILIETGPGDGAE